MSDIIYISYHHRLAMASLNRCSVAPYTLGRGGVHRLGPQIGAPKPRVPNYRWCTVVPRNSIVNMVKSPVSALRTQWRFFAFSPPNLTNFQTTLSNCQFVLLMVLLPMTRYLAIGGQTPKIHTHPNFGGIREGPRWGRW